MIFLNNISESDYAPGKRYLVKYKGFFQWGLMMAPLKQYYKEPLSFYIAMQPALFPEQYYGPSIVSSKDIYDVVKVCDCCGKLI